MSRKKLYESPAARQAAYIARLKGSAPAPAPKPAAPKYPAPPSERRGYAAMLQALAEEVEAVRDKFQAWFDSLPDNMADGDKAHTIEAIIEALDEAYSQVDGCEVPARQAPNMGKRGCRP